MKENKCNHEFESDGGSCIHCKKTLTELMAGKNFVEKKVIIRNDDGDYYHTYIDNNQTMKNEVFDRIIKYCKDNECFLGEVVQQSDGCIIDAPYVLSDIIDNIIKFECVDVDKNEL